CIWLPVMPQSTSFSFLFGASSAAIILSTSDCSALISLGSDEQLCAWSAWAACPQCKTVRTRACRCSAAAPPSPPPVGFGLQATTVAPAEPSSCPAGVIQGGECPSDPAACFYAGSSSGILTLGLSLLFLSCILLVWLKMRRGIAGGAPARRAAMMSSSRHSAALNAMSIPPISTGAAVRAPAPAYDAPPSYIECVLDSGSGPAAAAAPGPGPDDLPPDYEEAVARFKREVQFSTQRCPAQHCLGGGDNCAFVGDDSVVDHLAADAAVDDGTDDAGAGSDTDRAGNTVPQA
ncbi:hypothetical protein BOX15_Mlig004336g1, partial [Macrostomum lignano]